MKRWLTALSIAAGLALFSFAYLENHNAHAAHLPTAGQPRIAQYQDDAAAAISFTFDDGLQCHSDIALPMLQHFGLRATFYIAPGLVRNHPDDPRILNPKLHFGEGGLCWDEIRRIHDAGMEIGNHSLTHTFLNHLTDDTLLDEQINHAADLITQNIGEPPLTFAFPYNESTPHCRKLVLQHHLAIRDNWTDYGGPTFTTDVANALVQKSIRNHAWLVPMIHGIDGGFLPLSSTVLHDHLAFITSHLDELWVATYAEVARYETERNAATLHIQDSNPGELTFLITTPAQNSAPCVPLTVVLPLPLNENTDDVDARTASAHDPVPITREPDRILVTLNPGTPVIVTWH